MTQVLCKICDPAFVSAFGWEGFWIQRLFRKHQPESLHGVAVGAHSVFTSRQCDRFEIGLDRCIDIHRHQSSFVMALLLPHSIAYASVNDTYHNRRLRFLILSAPLLNSRRNVFPRDGSGRVRTKMYQGRHRLRALHNLPDLPHPVGIVRAS